MVEIRQGKGDQEEKENWNEVRFIDEDDGGKMGSQL